MEQKLKAIIIKVAPMGESDLLVTYLTEHGGTQRAVAKGAKKLKNALSGGMMPMGYSELLVVKGKGTLKTITQYKSIETYPAVKKDLLKTAYGYVILEAIYKSSPEGHESFAFFDLGLKTLRFLNETKKPNLLFLWFLTQVLIENGILPDLEGCATCGTLLPERKAVINTHHGAYYCDHCGHGEFEVRSGDLKLLRILLEWQDFATLETIPIPVKSQYYYIKIWIKFLEIHGGITFQSLPFLRECIKNHPLPTDV